MQAELKKMLTAKPFVPFTIVMSDGTHMTVKHSENALLMKHWIYVTTDGGETAEHLYLLHVTSASSASRFRDSKMSRRR